MALKENYVDDILNTSKNTKRKYNMLQNGDGTVSFEDVTEYSQNGDNFGSADVNAITKAINELAKAGNYEEIIPTLSDYNSSVGTCIYASQISTEYAPWKAFDNNVSTLGGCTGVGTGESSYIGFQWTNEVYIDNVVVNTVFTHGVDIGTCSLDLKLQYYDGSNWVDVENTEFNEVFTGLTTWQDRTYNFSVFLNAKGIRFFGSVSNIAAGYKWNLFIREMKAYGR